MLQHLPASVGRALSGRRAGLDSLVIATEGLAPPGGIIGEIALESPAFAAGGTMPTRFTEDGDGVSPPLRWSGVPAGARTLVLLVEDADSPTPKPLVHAIVSGLEQRDGALAEGAIGEDAPAGRNSFLSHAWLPPDPPPGHGPHQYVFQLYALDDHPTLGENIGRSGLVAALHGHVIGLGVLVGVYEREAEPGA